MDIGLHDEQAGREAVRRQVHNYCRAMDRRDGKLGYWVWAGGSVVENIPWFF